MQTELVLAHLRLGQEVRRRLAVARVRRELAGTVQLSSRASWFLSSTHNTSSQ